MSRRRRRNRYKFTEKVHSKKGILAMLLALALVCEFMIFVYLAFNSGGNLSMYFGSAGVLSILFTIIVMVLAFQSMKEENSFKLFPRLACFFSILAFGIWVGTYVFGIVLI